MENVADKALELLKALAEKIGTTVEKLYPYFVRQVYLEGWTQLLGWVIGCGVVATAGFGLTRVARRELAKPGPDEEWFWGLVFGYVVILMATVFATGAIASYLPSVLNPEYEAIRRIMSVATGR